MQKLMFMVGLAFLTTIAFESISLAQESELERRLAEIEMMQEEFEREWERRRVEEGDYFDESAYKAEKKFMKKEVEIEKKQLEIDGKRRALDRERQDYWTNRQREEIGNRRAEFEKGRKTPNRGR